jgi:hypothetical protein
MASISKHDLEDEKQCILVLIGATSEGRKELVALLAFYDFPAEHWKHLRLPIPLKAPSPPYATARCCRRAGLSNRTALAMVFKLLVGA